MAQMGLWGLTGWRSDSDVKTALEEARAALAAANSAEATGQNARQMVLNRDQALTNLTATAATLDDIVNAASVEHAAMREEYRDLVAEIQATIDELGVVPGPPGADGQDGASAYQIARAHGYGGTETQWLATHKGEKGDRGDVGPQGPPGAGPPGSVYQIETRDNVEVPATTVLLGSATVDVPVTWDTPFPDSNYIVGKPQLTMRSLALLGRADATVLSKTATGCVVRVASTATLSVGSATIFVQAYRKA